MASCNGLSIARLIGMNRTLSLFSARLIDLVPADVKETLSGIKRIIS
ncbi:hypothetical protein Dhaf_4170 [Desulfitobacterium hafniense DCB-2]|uniref:Uncharacterized protein n=1 Tax=Desulfitobacterium hafniense (strain DSM 10664 / DCB-2) TaxID=272564 RepID=B8FTT6_DESHD|nr:hypothetical protein Dhaf_4170 [Desulfitobacterium hafniense DCB-2]